MEKSTCKVDSCPLQGKIRGLCNRHYLRLRRYGDPEASGRRSVRQRFEARVDRQPNGCWHWTGTLFVKTGYGQFHLWDSATKTSTLSLAHRVSHELHIGPIPEGLVIDHLCRVRHCVNPDHLEAVSQRTNMLRGVAPAAIAVRENRCARGHEFTPENTIVRNRDGRTKRDCRECTRARDRARNKTPHRRAQFADLYRKRRLLQGGDAP